MAEEAGYFAIDDVLRELADKLIRRHPHVFAEPGSAATPDEALGRWNAAKAAERAAAGAASEAPPPSLMAGIPKDLPALAEAGKMGGRAARAGFDWPAVEPIWSKIEEELAELRAALTRPAGGCRSAEIAEIEDELGDVLFSVVNLARRLELDPEAALKRANRKFIRRFQHMEQAAQAQGRDLTQLAAAEWDEWWRESKTEHP
jgi:MazG family protein